MKNLILTVGLLAVALLTASIQIPASAETVPASDIKGHWASESITKALDTGLVTNKANGAFQPNDTISRMDFLAWTDKALGNVIKQVPGTAEATMKTLSIPAGTAVTRQQAARVLASLIKMDGMADSSKLAMMKDVSSIHMPAVGAVGALMDCGVFKGYTDNTFRPTRTLTRAEAVVLLGKVAMKASMGISDKSSASPMAPAMALPDSSTSKTYEGLIIDKHCFPLGNPEKDTLMCLKMVSCAASGYGLAVKAMDGTWSFTLFSADSQVKAVGILDKTSKKSNITVKATGTVKAGVLSLSDIVENP